MITGIFLFVLAFAIGYFIATIVANNKFKITNCSSNEQCKFICRPNNICIPQAIPPPITTQPALAQPTYTVNGQLSPPVLTSPPPTITSDTGVTTTDTTIDLRDTQDIRAGTDSGKTVQGVKLSGAPGISGVDFASLDSATFDLIDQNRDNVLDSNEIAFYRQHLAK